jgi:hypothetical protein
MTQTTDLTDQALAAYFTRCQEEGVYYQQPANYSGLRTYDGKPYVVLENIHGPLAVYLVGPDGELEDITGDYDRWPGELREQHPDSWLAAWALTRDEAIDAGYSFGAHGHVTISREGTDPEPSVYTFDSDIGFVLFDEGGADELLESNGYRRTGPWHSGSMDGRPPYANSVTEGHSCEIIRVSEDA